MKTNAVVLILLIAMVATLLAGSVALAQSGGQPPLASYVVEQGTISGGGYHLTSLAPRYAQGEPRQASRPASGGRYHLLGPAAPALAGSGCCCTYMPCVLRNRH